MLVYAILALVLLVVITNQGFLRFKGTQPFRQDQLIQKEKDERKLTFLYKFGKSVKESTSENISRYTMISDNGSRSLVVTYEKKFKKILYYVYMYSISNKLIGILEIEEHSTKINSEEIKLPKNCKKVNFLVTSVDGLDYDVKVVSPVGFLKLFMYSIFETACLASIIILGSIAALNPTDNVLLGINTITSIVCFVNFVVVLIVLIKRNKIRK